MSSDPSQFDREQRIAEIIDSYSNTVGFHGTDMDFLLGETRQLKLERDQAIAHDRQPYPTAWAYEQVCKTLHKKEDEVRQLQEESAVLRNEVLQAEDGIRIEREKVWEATSALVNIRAFHVDELQKTKAEGWDEGHEAGRLYGITVATTFDQGNVPCPPRQPNPHRRTSSPTPPTQ